MAGAVDIDDHRGVIRGYWFSLPRHEIDANRYIPQCGRHLVSNADSRIRGTNQW